MVIYHYIYSISNFYYSCVIFSAIALHQRLWLLSCCTMCATHRCAV